MNTVEVLGNLTKDPIIRNTKSGRPVASFSVACNRNYVTPQGEQKELTDYVSVVAWGPLAAAVCKYLNKGKRVFVKGRYSTRSYDGQDGQKKYVTEVVASVVALPLPTMNNNQQGQPYNQPNQYNQPPQNNGQWGNGNGQSGWGTPNGGTTGTFNANQFGPTVPQEDGLFNGPQNDEDIPF